MYGSYPAPSHGDERRAGGATQAAAVARSLGQPQAAPGSASAGALSAAGDVHEARNVVDRPEVVDMRQDRAHAAGLGLEAFVAKQRIEPNQPPAGLVQPLHLDPQDAEIVAVQPVR